MNFVLFGIPIHICQHEMPMVMSLIAVATVTGGWIKAKLCSKRKQSK